MHHRTLGAERLQSARPRVLSLSSLGRAVSLIVASAAIAFASGCSGGGSGGDGGDGGGGAGGSTGTNTSTSGAIDWNGTWSVQLDYSVDCDYSLGNVKHADNSQTNSMHLTASGSGVSADIDGYQMSGTGNATSLSLSGQYPVMDEGQSVAGDVQADNNVTIKITSVTDNNHGKGTVSGVFQGQFGATCTISNGSAALSR